MGVHTEAGIKVGEKWEQVVTLPDGSSQVRVVEITNPPTLSMPVSYRIIRNDAHPHRVGKHASIRQSEFRRKYWPVGS